MQIRAFRDVYQGSKKQKLLSMLISFIHPEYSAGMLKTWLFVSSSTLLRTS